MEERQYTFSVTPADKDKRFDIFLAEQMGETYSRSFLQRLISDGRATINGALVTKSSHMVQPGDKAELFTPKPREYFMRAENIPLDIAYEDEDLLVVNKPAHMVTHPAPGNYSGTLVNALLNRYKDLSGIGGAEKPGIVHRLDKGTSGLLVVAKTDKVHAGLQKQFKDKTAGRTYIAVARGVIEHDNGIIKAPLGRSVYDRKKVAVDEESGRDAITRYKVLKRYRQATLVELTLGTGRTHQIRVHMAHIGHPLLGDEQYGVKASIDRPALHAKQLRFIHPVTKKEVIVTSELPDDMKRLIKEIEDEDKHQSKKDPRHSKDTGR